MALSFADILERKLKLLDNKKLPSKIEFGLKMHDDSLTDEQKKEIVEKVVMAGGYDGLPDE